VELDTKLAQCLGYYIRTGHDITPEELDAGFTISSVCAILGTEHHTDNKGAS
jgi:uncharacterized protein (DUF2164 family)